MGIIDSLSAGYKLISRRWWLILVPVVLDLFLWMGPRLAVTEVMGEAASMLTVPAGVEISEEYASYVTQVQQTLQLVSEDTNLFGLLGAGLPGIPSLMAATTTEANLLGMERSVIQLGGVGQTILWGLLLLIAGTLLTSLYVSWVGRAVLADYREIRGTPIVEHSFRTWIQVLLFFLGIVALFIVLGLPIGLLVGLVSLLSPSFGIMLTYVISLFALWFGVWLVIYLYFVIDAIVLDRVNILRAVWHSINVVLRNFWPTFGLIVLVWVINAGMTLIWQQFAFASWGMLIGIVANAFVGTGLIAASLIFYNERFARWQEDPGAPGVTLLFRKWGGPKAS